MIPNITRGTRVQGLLRYLYGPGRKEEHTNPHLVGAWHGAGELSDLDPATTPAGQRDFRRLTELLEIPVKAGRNPPHKPVWHCSVRAHPTDPILTDQQWQDIAERVVARVGLTTPDDRGVRWVAVRHADDHIHILATLVRQDRRTCWARNDYPLSQTACRDIETQYDLYRVGQPGTGTRAWPKAGELNKTIRKGRPVAPREVLRRRVRDAATTAVNETDFFARLTHDRAVSVRLRHSTRNPDEVTGYAVTLNGDTTATGEPIFHSGGKLAADLSLTRLRTRWQPETGLASSDRRAHQLRPTPADVYNRAAQIAREASARIAANLHSPPTVATTIGAAADLLAAMAATWESTTGGPLTRAAELFDRAAYHTGPPAPARTGTASYTLRAVARLLATTRTTATTPGERELQALQRLIAAMAELADAVAALRVAHQRLHQAEAARATAAQLSGYHPPYVAHTVAAQRPSLPGVDPLEGVQQPNRRRR